MRDVPPVTVAVVSWNTRELLLRCLRALRADARAGRAEVWVLDNGSDDGSPAAVRASAPWARLVEASENLGFGRAVNLVARRTRSPWLVCANADTEPQSGALERLLEAGRAERVGCVAPRLILPDGSTQHSVHPFPTVPFTAAFNLGLQRLHPRWGEERCLEGYWDPERPRAVPWAIGAFLLLRRSAFEGVGGFDERRFMYAEDLDLGWRLREAGWETRYEPCARVGHSSGAATALAFGSDRRERFMRETYAVIRERQGPLRASVAGALNVAGAAARVAWMAPPALGSARWRARLRETQGWLRAHLWGLAHSGGDGARDGILQAMGAPSPPAAR